MSSIPLLSALAVMLFATGFGAALVFIATGAGILFRLSPDDEERKLGWLESARRQTALTNRVWVAPEYAKERRRMAWAFGIMLLSVALFGLIAPNGLNGM